MCEYISIADLRRRDFAEMAVWLFDNGGEGLSDIARAENIVLSSYLRGLGSKCIAICEGNHEEAIRKYSEHDAYSAQVEMLADGANEHRLDHRGIIQLRFRRLGSETWTLPILATHGSGSGESAGALDNRLKMIIDQFDGIRILVAGHWHEFGQKAFIRTSAGANGQTEDSTIWGLGVPSLCSDMRYSENRDKRHLVMGWWEIYVTPDKHRYQVAFKEV